MKRIISIFLSICVIVAFCFFAIASSSADYKEAEKFVELGRYEDAVRIFETLASQNYKDSASRANQTKYMYVEKNYDCDDELTYSGMYELVSKIRNELKIIKKCAIIQVAHFLNIVMYSYGQNSII